MKTKKYRAKEILYLIESGSIFKIAATSEFNYWFSLSKELGEVNKEYLKHSILGFIYSIPLDKLKNMIPNYNLDEFLKTYKSLEPYLDNLEFVRNRIIDDYK